MKIRRRFVALVVGLLAVILSASGGAQLAAAQSAAPIAETLGQRGATADTPIDISCVEPYKSKMKPIKSTASDAEIKDIIAKHNAARAEIASPPLVWDPKTAEFAQGWVNALKDYQDQKATSVLSLGAHSSLAAGGETCYSKQYGESYGAVGENIGTVEGWIAEKKDWHADTRRCTGDQHKGIPGECGHYLQVVASWVTKVGCGKIEGGGWICSYDHIGNIMQQDGRSYDPRGDGKTAIACGNSVFDALVKANNAGTLYKSLCDSVIAGTKFSLSAKAQPVGTMITVIAVPLTKTNISLSLKDNTGRFVGQVDKAGPGQPEILSFVVDKERGYEALVTDLDNKPYDLNIAIYLNDKPGAAAQPAQPSSPAASFKEKDEVAYSPDSKDWYKATVTKVDASLVTVSYTDQNSKTQTPPPVDSTPAKPGATGPQILTLTQATDLKLTFIAPAAAQPAQPVAGAVSANCDGVKALASQMGLKDVDTECTKTKLVSRTVGPTFTGLNSTYVVIAIADKSDFTIALFGTDTKTTLVTNVKAGGSGKPAVLTYAILDQRKYSVYFSGTNSSLYYAVYRQAAAAAPAPAPAAPTFKEKEEVAYSPDSKEWYKATVTKVDASLVTVSYTDQNSKTQTPPPIDSTPAKPGATGPQILTLTQATDLKLTFITPAAAPAPEPVEAMTANCAEVLKLSLKLGLVEGMNGRCKDQSAQYPLTGNYVSFPTPRTWVFIAIADNSDITVDILADDQTTVVKTLSAGGPGKPVVLEFKPTDDKKYFWVVRAPTDKPSIMYAGAYRKP